jgi:hypothetical protein
MNIFVISLTVHFDLVHSHRDGRQRTSTAHNKAVGLEQKVVRSEICCES